MKPGHITCDICGREFSISENYRLSPPDENGDRNIICSVCLEGDNFKKTWNRSIV